MSNIIRNRAATNLAAKAPEQAEQRTPPTLLAQIPDLDATHSPARIETLGDGRILNQALSVRLVVGAGAVLVMLALMASFWNRATRPAVVKELPAWKVPSGTSPASAASTNAPAFVASPPAPTTKAIAEAPHKAPHIDIATRPAVAQTPAPAVTPPAPAALPAPATPAPLQVARPLVSNLVEGTNYRNYDRPGSGVYSADTRNDAAAGYRPAGGYDQQDRGGAMRGMNGAAANNVPAPNYGPANGLPNNGGYPVRNDVNPATGAQYLPPVIGPSRTEYAPPVNYPPANNYQPQGSGQPQGNYPPQYNYPPNNAPNVGGYQPQGYQNGPQYPTNNPYGNSGSNPGAARFDGTINNAPANYSR